MKHVAEFIDAEIAKLRQEIERLQGAKEVLLGHANVVPVRKKPGRQPTAKSAG